MPLILGTNSIKDTGFDVANSLRFDGGSSDYLERTPSSSGNRRTFTLSVWIKKSENGDQVIFGAGNSGSNKDQIYFRFPSDVTENTLDVLFYQSSSVALQLRTTQYFRDPSAWFHFVISIDTTQSTSSNRAKIYLNGNQITNFSVETYPSQNLESLINSTISHKIGIDQNGSGNGMNGYFSEMVFIDGQQLNADSFGEFDEDSSIWKPKDVSGLTFGTNGFYLNVPGPSTGQNANGLGGDSSGNGNHFASSGLSAEDQVIDTPTNNFATWNSLFRKGTTTPAFSEGNLKSTFDDGGANEFALTTFGVDTGKWYSEVKWTSATGTGATATGILDMAYSGTADPNTSVTNAFGYFGNGNKNVSGTGSSYGASYTSGDIIGIALNCDDNQVTFYKNGSSQGTISIISGVTYGIFASDYNNKVAELNTGNPPFSISSGNTDGNGYGNFEYAPPSGYFALCTKNLAEYG